MATTGTVVNRIDTPIMGGTCQMSLRLKRKGDDSDAYVVLAGIGSGDYQFYPMNAEEFTRFAEAVQTIQGQLSSLNKR
jgi:hypothetical protein